MNKEIKILKAIKLIILVVFFTTTKISGQTSHKTWDYPVKPGTTQWAELKTNEEKFDACQIPNKILKSLSTSDLIELCTNYPLFYNVILYKNLIIGFNQLKTKFSGFQELSMREDLDNEMLDFYRNLSINDDVYSLTEQEKREIVAKALRIELIISCEVLEKESNLSIADEFALESLKKYNIKKNNPNIFSSFSYQLPLYILAKSLSVNSKKEYDSLLIRNPELQNFMSTCNLSSVKLERDILKLAESCLINH